MTSTANSSAPLSPSTPPNAPNSGGTDIISLNGSPTLIAAFLAIGFFAIALTGVFGWRQFFRLRRLVGLEQSITRPRSPPVSLGDKPTLWDVWTDLKTGEESLIEASSWQDITPMATILTFPVPSVGHSLTWGSSRGHVLFRTLRCLLLPVKLMNSCLSDSPPQTPLPVTPPPLPRNEPGEVERGDASSLQVTVIVAMPTTRRQRYDIGGTSDAQKVDPVFGELCLGTMDVNKYRIAEGDARGCKLSY